MRRITAMLYLGRRHPRSPGYYRDAGEALLALKAAEPQRWLEIALEACGIGRRRAYELTVLANQKKSLIQLRAENAARVRKHRKDRWLPTKAPRQKGPKAQSKGG